MYSKAFFWEGNWINNELFKVGSGYYRGCLNGRSRQYYSPETTSAIPYFHVFTIFLTIHDSVPSFTTNLQQVLLLGIQVESTELSRAIGTAFFFPSPLYNQTQRVIEQSVVSCRI